jgi:rhamnogalacturonan endolyase
VHGATYLVASFASTNFVASDFTVTGLPSGYAAAVTVSATSLQLTIFATPIINSPTAASGTYGQPFSYTITALNSPASFNATNLPSWLTLNATTGVISGTAGAAGTFTVSLGATNIAGTGTATLTITIAKAIAPISVGTPANSTLIFAYNGSAQSATITTVPAGLNATFTYNGSSTAPTLPGTYAVVATINDPNYQGTATGTLVITITALVRHAPIVHGSLDGSMQVLSPEDLTLGGSTAVSGDLLVPGTPDVSVTGNALFAGTQDATGAVAPSSYGVSLTGDAVLRYVVRRVDAIPLPSASAPQSPAGTRDVSLHNDHRNPGNFATIRDLTLGGDLGGVAVPPGAYGELQAGGNTSFVLGEAGGTTPAIYDVQRLTLNGNATLEVVGPVILRLANSLVLADDAGSAAHPEWLMIQLAAGDLTLNGDATLHADAIAPNGTITISGNATLHGHVSADRLVLEGNALLDDPAP